MTARILKKPEIEYPSSDGKPMAESDRHREKMVANIQRLQRFFVGRKVYVSGNLLIYYVEGDRCKSVAPDAFVVKNCKPGERETFSIWKEGKKPNFALETTSKTTRGEDVGRKKTIYAQIGVKEYFLYDPRGDWLKPPLQGYRLVDGAYERIPPDAEGGVTSKELGIRFVLEDGDLVMFDVATGARLLAEAERANVEQERANEAQRQVGEQKRQAEEAQQQAEEQKHRADDAEEALRQSQQRAIALEEELARLRAAPKTNGRRENGK
jgi:Uma2 family endonuclease